MSTRYDVSYRVHLWHTVCVPEPNAGEHAVHASYGYGKQKKLAPVYLEDQLDKE